MRKLLKPVAVNTERRKTAIIISVLWMIRNILINQTNVTAKALTIN